MDQQGRFKYNHTTIMETHARRAWVVPKLHSIYYESFVIIFYCLARKEIIFFFASN